MEPQMISLFIILSILWFLIYWILGGVFFAIVTIMRLGRVRKVRFSCLFSLLSLVLGIGVAYVGLRQSKETVSECFAQASSKIEMLTAIFGCGFAWIFGSFLLGAFLLTIGGFLIMAISKSKTRPWIVLDHEDLSEPSPVSGGSQEPKSKSQFFES